MNMKKERAGYEESIPKKSAAYWHKLRVLGSRELHRSFKEYDGSKKPYGTGIP